MPPATVRSNNIINAIYIMSLCSACSYLIVSILCDVPHPWQCLISTLLNNLKITHLNSADRKIGYLKLKLDWYFLVIISVVVLYRWETELRAHQEFFPSGELLDNPDHTTLIWNILDSSHICLEDWRVNIYWHGYDDLHIIGDRFLFELRPCLDNEFDF